MRQVQNPKRKRGVLLTAQGLKKLLEAKRKSEIWDNYGERYTLEELSNRTGLASITIAKVLNGESGVDRQTLVCCFSAFNLSLEESDYANPSSLYERGDKPSNPSMQNDEETIPIGWGASGSHPQDYDMRIDYAVKHSGCASGLIQSRVPTPSGFGTMMQMFNADSYRSQRLKFSGYLKTEAVETWAGLWMRVDGQENQMLSFDNMQNRSIKGTIDWTQYHIVLDVPENASKIAFGVLLAGVGRVWSDDLQFEVVGQDVPTTNMMTMRQISEQPMNLDFEAPQIDLN